jgi:hypothetical protein
VAGRQGTLDSRRLQRNILEGHAEKALWPPALVFALHSIAALELLLLALICAFLHSRGTQHYGANETLAPMYQVDAAVRRRFPLKVVAVRIARNGG